MFSGVTLVLIYVVAIGMFCCTLQQLAWRKKLDASEKRDRISNERQSKISTIELEKWDTKFVRSLQKGESD